jgi:biotin carboxylase
VTKARVPHVLLLGGPSWLVSHLTGVPVRVTVLERPQDPDSATAGFVDRVISIDYVEDPRIIEIVRALHAADRFDAVLPLDEYGMTLASQLCRELSISGDSAGAWELSRHKLRCRQRLAEAGLPAVRYTAAENADHIRSFIADSGATIVKPMSGGGSEGVSLLENADEDAAQRAFERAREADAGNEVIAEEYLRGDEVSVETISQGGKHHVIGVTRKESTGAPLFIEVGHVFPANRGDLGRIAEAAAGTLTAIGLEHGPAHIEFVVGQENVRVVEVNARLGGGLIWELVELATGLDLMRLAVASILGWPMETTPARDLTAAVHFLTAPCTGVLARLAGRAEAAAMPGVVRTGTWVKEDHVVHGLRSHADRLGYAIALGDSETEAQARAEAAIGRLEWEWSVRV